MKAFLDTNIILDILMESRESHVDSASILQVADAGHIATVISTQSILDAYYVSVDVAKTSPDDFKAALNEILSVTKVDAIDEQAIRAAIRSRNNDLEDAAQIACADAAGCDCIISSDKKMRRDSHIKVYTPAEFCDMLFH